MKIKERLSIMSEYEGQLIGGPYNGRKVVASVAEIPVVNTVELWLDGVHTGKMADVGITRGRYVWDKDSQYFTWVHDSNLDFKSDVF